MSAAAITPLCEISHVSHDFKRPSGQCLRVLEDVSLQIRANEVVALLGPSGCGKSTILRILSGLIAPTEGVVRSQGETLTGLNEHVAMVFQSFALYPWKTARENIQAVLRARGLPVEAITERTEQVISMVGLSGFVNAYPRELSGGMKQRIGIARAIAVDRELLFMDEPFSQVDALTAESLRSEVLDLWSPAGRNPSSIVMVSHDIKEVVYMADRIVVLGANPGRIRTIIDNPLPRPRDYRSVEFLQLVDRIHDLITGLEMPDAQPRPMGAANTNLEPLPPAVPSEIVGLIEYLAARRGQEDVFRIGSDTGREFGIIISVVRAAEVLEFVDTPKRLVVLTPEGRAFAKASAEDRKSIWCRHLIAMNLFRRVHDLVARQPAKMVDRDIIEEMIVLAMPHEDHAAQFGTLMAWSRFGGFLAYDEANGKVSFQVTDSSSGSAASSIPQDTETSR